MLEIHLLGKFDVRFDGVPVVIPSRPAQALLARLAMTAGITHRRELLAGQLWPDTTEDRGRSNLRHALWRIRAALKSAGLSGDPIHSDGIGITFDPAADAWVDAREFERLCQIRPASVEAVMMTAALYQGALLPGFYDDWATAQRDRLQLTYDALMSPLIAQLRAERRWLDVLYWATIWAAQCDGDDVSPHALAAVRVAMREVLMTGPETHVPAKPVAKALKHMLKRLSVLLGEHALPQPRAWPAAHDRRRPHRGTRIGIAPLARTPF